MKQFRDVTEALADMQIMREPTHLEWLTASRLSLNNAISIYDAIHLGFAVSRQSKMVTADTSLLSKTRSAEAKGSLLALTDLTLSI